MGESIMYRSEWSLCNYPYFDPDLEHDYKIIKKGGNAVGCNKSVEFPDFRPKTYENIKNNLWHIGNYRTVDDNKLQGIWDKKDSLPGFSEWIYRTKTQEVVFWVFPDGIPLYVHPLYHVTYTKEETDKIIKAIMGG